MITWLQLLQVVAGQCNRNDEGLALQRKEQLAPIGVVVHVPRNSSNILLSKDNRIRDGPASTITATKEFPLTEGYLS